MRRWSDLELAPQPFKTPSLPLHGGCSCGSLRYRIDHFPLGLYACHCTDCQRQSGSAFAMTMPVGREAFFVTGGYPKSWTRQSKGASVTAWICDTCGVRIYGERSSRPGSVTVRAGTLDDTSWLRPAAHVFMRSAQPWENIDEAICFDEWPDDFKEIATRWRARWMA